MNDPTPWPTRWRDDVGVDEERRALLLAHRGCAPSKRQADLIWLGLESQLHIAPMAPPVAPAGPIATVAGALATKVTVTVVLLAAAGTGLGLRHAHTRARMAGQPTTAKASSRTASPVAGAPTLPTLPAMQAEPKPSPSEPPGLQGEPDSPGMARRRPATARALASTAKAGPTATSPSRPAAERARLAPSSPPGTDGMIAPPSYTARDLVAPRAPQLPRDEITPVNLLLLDSRRLELARAALRAKDPDRALRWLSASTSSALAQEREALTVEAMAAKPDLRTAAAERARRFLRTYPQSPYRSHIKAIAAQTK